jgi:soluble lytic murein transglycosylase
VSRGLKFLLLVGLAAGVAWFGWERFSRERRYDRLIRSASSQHGLPPALVKAVVWRESRFDPDARGSHGEFGLMQVTETAAQEWADWRGDRGFRHEHTLDAATNLHAGCFYLSRLCRRYQATDRPYAFALADYNAGRGNVLRWAKGPAATNSAAFLEAMTFPRTREYVEAILARQPRYVADFR